MGIEVLVRLWRTAGQMKLSNAAEQLLAQLCMTKDAYLFGERDGDAPFKLNYG
jgi:hypothetical protein